MQLRISIAMCQAVPLVESAPHNACLETEIHNISLRISQFWATSARVRSPPQSTKWIECGGHTKPNWRKEKRKTIYSLKHGQTYGSAALISTLDLRNQSSSIFLSSFASISVSLSLSPFALILFIYFCYRYVRVDFCFHSRSNYRSFTWLARHYVVLHIIRFEWSCRYI